MELKFNKEELEEKNRIIDNAIVQLKKEFVGIDSQIDAIMDNVRVWFLYPDLQASPCVVNIFGMTGCGKTSLVKRIAQLLDRERDVVYFNFCAINEEASYEIEESIEENFGNGSTNRIFVYDEFQFAATLDENGAEKDKKGGLKPFWELLDTGVLCRRMAMWYFVGILRVVKGMARINSFCQMEIENGCWVNKDKCLEFFDEREKKELMNVFNTLPGEEDFVPIKLVDDDKEDDFFIPSHVFDRFSEVYCKVYNVAKNTFGLKEKLRKMSANEIYDLFYSVYKKALRGYELKFNNSIIFVIANVDEAYDMAYDVNPDMSPDQFYNITRKISIVDVKKALQKRFRNEQIARLGNVYVIYPSLNSKSFKRVIELYLNKYGDRVKELCGINVKFDKSINDAIFKESVYPTQGVRPILSTIYEFVKAKLPHMVKDISEGGMEGDAVSICYSYKNKKTVVEVFNNRNEMIGTFKYVNNLRLGKLRESAMDERQANTAVHESGHFVVYSYLYGKIPEKIVSCSVENGIGGFMMNDLDNEEKRVDSRVEYLNKIKVFLGGYAAEGIIFGNDRRSSGASSDLMEATTIASKMIRKFGMGYLACVTTYLNKTEVDGMIIKEDNQEYINKQIKDIISKCLADTEKILRQANMYDMLVKSSKYLAVHSQMSKHTMNKLLEEAQQNGDICANTDTYYRDIVNSL